MEEYKKEQNRTKKERKEDGARTKRNAFVCAAAMMFIAAALMTAFTFAAPSSEDAGDDQTIGSNGDTFDYTSAPNLKLTYMVTSEDPNTAQVYGYISGITHEMRIPSTVTNNGKEYIVTSIGDGVFNAKENEEIKKKLNKVVLPDSVTVIGKEAFVHCANLEGINLDKITSVGMLAFIHCTSLTSVELPMAEIIEAGAFTNCNNMTYAFVGGSLTHLGEFAFYSDRLGALAIPYGTILGEQPVDHSVTVLVHYEGAPAVSAVRDGNEVKLTIHAEIPASELTVGTAHGGNGVTVTGEDHEWSFVKQFIKNEYYAKFVQAVSFTVSGKVTDGVNGIAGAAIAYTVTGTPGIQVIETANNGTYAIEAPWGSEVSIISVVRSGYVSAQSMPLYFSGKATQNFVMNGGHGTTYTVTGSVKHGTHALNGVNISYIIYGGGAGNVKTDANGKYVISGIPSGAVVHINDAQKDGFTNTTHLPAELYVDGNKTADIAMSPVPGHHLTISGKAELNGAGLENVTISYTADGINQPSALTDKFGNYKITVPAGSVVIITAAKDTYVVKTSYAELYMSENRTGVDFAFDYDRDHWAIVIFDPENGEPPAQVWHEIGTKLTKPDDPVKSTYKFAGWSFAGALWNFGSDIVGGDMTLTAEYDHDETYWATVIFDPDNSTGTTEIWHSKGTVLADPIIPVKGSLKFIGWFLSDAEWNFNDIVTKDITLKAKYENDPEYHYKVTFNADNGLPPQEVWTLKGDTVAEPAVPVKGSLTFIGWFLGDKEWDFNDAITLDITLKAKYENDPEYYFKVIFDADNGTGPEEAWVLKGTVVDEPNVPTKGSLTFVGWFLGDTEWNFSDAVTSDITLKAKYENDPEYHYKVTFDADNGSSTEAWVLKGEIVAEPGTPAKGSLTFIGWFLGDAKWDFADAIISDITLKAKYENDPEY
ncbi:MAG: InlB B-repeat-containing protein, partial [Methanomassiliicoccaceae archaeon]|nr:InlB B-repeat-containing protein [Methanomassiliicoccaceae archaeon]